MKLQLWTKVGTKEQQQRSQKKVDFNLFVVEKTGFGQKKQNHRSVIFICAATMESWLFNFSRRIEGGE